MSRKDEKPKLRLGRILLGLVLIIVGFCGFSYTHYSLTDIEPFAIIEALVSYVVMIAGAVLFDGGLPE
jgi:hypothetical protein